MFFRRKRRIALSEGTYRRLVGEAAFKGVAVEAFMVGLLDPPQDEGKNKSDDIIVTARFSRSTYQVIVSVATEKNVSRGEALRDLIAYGKYVYDAVKKGGRILIEAKNGSKSELLIK